MIKTPYGGALALPLLLCATPAMAEDAAAGENAAPLTDTIVVTAQRKAALALEADPVDGHASLPDAAALTARLPGAALVGNGPISGQVQFRGLFSDRLAIRVGGQAFQTGGPQRDGSAAALCPGNSGAEHLSYPRCGAGQRRTGDGRDDRRQAQDRGFYQRIGAEPAGQSGRKLSQR